MPALRFTDTALRNLRLPPKPKQVPYFETMQRGLALVLTVSYGGTKSWSVVTYDVGGKARSRKLGLYPAVPLKEARKLAREAFENPEKFAARAAVGTFEEVADNWIRRHVEKNGLRSQHEIQRILNRYVLPKWKVRPFLEIRRLDINALLDEIEDENGRSQADAVLAVVRGICNWYQARDENYVSPVVRGMKRDRRPPKEKARSRVLSDDEIRLIWKVPGSFGGFLKLLLLSAQRREKVSTMRWMDIVDGVWAIPSEDREKGTAGRLTLPQLALDVIASQPRIADNPFVFAGRGKTAFNHFSEAKGKLDAALPADMPHWTLHDLRRTARSLMSRADVRPDIAERVLGHAIAGVEAVYDRHGYDTHKADALERLDSLLETIVKVPVDLATAA